jgi:hypothetical protein
MAEPCGHADLRLRGTRNEIDANADGPTTTRFRPPGGPGRPYVGRQETKCLGRTACLLGPGTIPPGISQTRHSVVRHRSIFTLSHVIAGGERVERSVVDPPVEADFGIR